MVHRSRHFVSGGMLAVLLAALTALLLIATATAPALAAAPEKPVTQAATAVTATEATLNGELNPNASTTAGFNFTYNSNGTCTEGPSTEPQPEQSGQAVKVQSLVKELIPSTEYTFCLLATHTEEEVTEASAGEPVTFKTGASKPAVDSQSASAITPFAATLEARINPENQPTTACTFEYGTLTVSEKTAPCEPGTLEGFGDQGVTAPLPGLSAATVYHYRVVVENATGTTDGPEQELTTLTLEKPVVIAQSSSGFTTTSATLEATLNPNYQQTTYSFQYATNEAFTGATTIEGPEPLGAEFAEDPVSVSAEGLTPGTTYFYRVLATNATGTTEGPVQSFITVGPPLLTPASVGSVTRTTAQLTGASIDSVGAPATYSYRYIDQVGYEAGLAEFPSNPYAKGARSLPAGELGSGYGPQAIKPTTISELAPATTYHFALVATNSAGTTFAPDATFTTPPATPPLTSTGAPEAVSQLSARITATVDTRELTTVAQFEFGTTPGAGSLLPASVAPGSGSTESLSLSFDGDLQPATTYYYRALATNADGAGYGAIQSFTTAAFPAQAVPAAASLIGWPAFVLKDLAAGPPREATAIAPKTLTKAQKLKKALKACNKKPKRKRAGCRRQAKRNDR